MEKQNPGIWIGAAIALAVIIVAVSVPRDPKETGPVPPGTAASAGTTRPLASPAATPAPPGEVIEATPPAPDLPKPPTSPGAPPAALPSRDPDDIPPPTLKPALPPATRENVRQAIDDLDLVIRDFRAALGGNPVGDNAEITRALLGDNLKQIKLTVPHGTQLNGTGELCDIWGTPYFFHQISGTQMEIRSAGPDRKHWTADDITK
jgi:hypothetical protein